MLNGHLGSAPQQATESGLASLDDDELSPAAGTGLRPNSERRSHVTTLLRVAQHAADKIIAVLRAEGA